MIKVEGLRHHYGVRPVLNGVGFEVRRGELVALMGPNGSGKSTLMGLLSGALSLWEGYIEIDGLRRKRSAEEEEEIRRRVAFLPAEMWVPAGLTPREFLVAVGELYRVSFDRLFGHIDRLIEVFELDAVQDSAIGSCSTGQRKKVALSSILVTDAPVLILDEPFSGGLDPAGISALEHILRHLAERQDVTVVMATPVPELVAPLAHRVLILRDGGVGAYGTPDELREMTGKTGAFDQVVTSIVNPVAEDHIARYFEGEQ